MNSSSSTSNSELSSLSQQHHPNGNGQSAGEGLLTSTSYMTSPQIMHEMRLQVSHYLLRARVPDLQRLIKTIDFPLYRGSYLKPKLLDIANSLSTRDEDTLRRMWHFIKSDARLSGIVSSSGSLSRSSPPPPSTTTTTSSTTNHTNASPTNMNDDNNKTLLVNDSRKVSSTPQNLNISRPSQILSNPAASYFALTVQQLRALAVVDDQFRRNPISVATKILSFADPTVKFNISEEVFASATLGRIALLFRLFRRDKRTNNVVSSGNQSWIRNSRLMLNSHVVYDALGTNQPQNPPEHAILNVTLGMKPGANIIDLQVDSVKNPTAFPDYPIVVCGMVFSVEIISTEDIIESVRVRGRRPYADCLIRVKNFLKYSNVAPKKRLREEEEEEEEEEDLVALTNQRLVLTDPLTLGRIKIAVRGQSCSHLQCFDLEKYIEMNRVARSSSRYRCPVCSVGDMKFSSLIHDTWFQSILDSPKTVNASAIEILPEGDWTVPDLDVGSLDDDEDDDDDDDDNNNRFVNNLGQIKRNTSGLHQLFVEEPSRPNIIAPPGSTASAAIELD